MKTDTLDHMTEAPGRAKNLPAPPTFATFEEERRHRKDGSPNEIGGWLQFQPLWNRITREQPDLFE